MAAFTAEDQTDRNVGSLRVLEKAGFRRIGVNRDFAAGRGEEIEETSSASTEVGTELSSSLTKAVHADGTGELQDLRFRRLASVIGVTRNQLIPAGGSAPRKESVGPDNDLRALLG